MGCIYLLPIYLYFDEYFSVINDVKKNSSIRNKNTEKRIAVLLIVV